jgi:hypothetical protein
LDDSPAVLRAMREVGEEFRQGQLAALPASAGAPRSSATPLGREKLN